MPAPVYLLLLQPPLQSQVKSHPEGISYNAGRMAPSLWVTLVKATYPAGPGGCASHWDVAAHTIFFLEHLNFLILSLQVMYTTLIKKTVES